MISKDEQRMSDRIHLEAAMCDYYQSCEKAGYDFLNDLPDIIYDSTRLSVEVLNKEDA